MRRNTNYSLYDKKSRKYLSESERQRFFNAAMEVEESKRLFLLMLYYTGARVSEVLAIEKDNIDFDEQMIFILTLKKRRSEVYRRIPLLPSFLLALGDYYQNISGMKLWSFSRCTAYRYVKAIMVAAGIYGIQACPKGLRHTFGVNAIKQGVPINKVKAWMGHQSIATTEIYLDVIGVEEREVYGRMWGDHCKLF